MSDKKRLAWVDIAKGISIILVVMMYSAYSVGEATGGTGFLHYVIGWATPFRMPEFFLISGLFLSLVLGRTWARYADRRVVHYFYFYFLWVLIMVVVKHAIGEQNPMKALTLFGISPVQPYGVLWFIYMLGVFSLTAKLLHHARIPHWVTIPVAAVLQMAHIDVESYAVTQFAAYFVFFYTGYAGAPLVFKLVGWVENHVIPALLGLAVWALVEGLLVFSPGFTLSLGGFTWVQPAYHVLPDHTQMGYAAFPPLHLVLAVLGAAALCAMGALLAKLWFMDWLRWLGEHSIVVYLAFTLPMSALRIAALKTGLLTDPGMLSLAVLVTSVATPVILYLFTQKTGIAKWLFERPAWAHIPGTPGSRSYVAPETAKVPVPAE